MYSLSRWAGFSDLQAWRSPESSSADYEPAASWRTMSGTWTG